jgi:DNA-binding beta-propeller fold protein YncE
VPKILKTLAIGLLCLLGLALVAGLGFGAWLVFPTAPRSAASLHFAGFIPLPKAKGAGALSVLDYLSIDGGNLFVTSESTGDVYRVPLAAAALPDGASVKVSAGAGAAHGVVIDPTSGRAFVSRSEANHVDVFDPGSLALLKSIPVADDVDGVFFDPANRLIFAVSGDPGLGTVIDPATQTALGTIPLGGKPEFAVFDPQTRVLYQNLEDKSVVAVVDLAKRVVVDRWPLKPCVGPTSAALDLADRRLFVVCSNALLVVVDLASHRVVASLPIGGGPDSVAYDVGLKRLYATGKSGVMSIIQQEGPDTYRTLDSITLHYGAHTLAVDPVTHRVYVGYASLIVPPRLAVFDVRP